MQFSVVAILAVFATSAYAIPTAQHYTRGGCDALSCATALGPTAVSCVSAAVQEGLDPLSDAGCLASSINTAVNTPAACTACAGSIGSKVTSALGSAESAIKNIF